MAVFSTGMGADVLGITDDQLEDAIRRGYVAAVRFLRNRDDAHDACQEAARKAWSARHRYDQDQPFYPWFYRILKNHCFDRLSRRKRRWAQREQVRTDPSVAGDQRTAEQRLMSEQRREAMERAIEQLPEDQREIIELRHFQDASYAEIAAALEIAEGTVMSRLYRARKRMRVLLNQDPAFSGEGRPT